MAYVSFSYGPKSLTPRFSFVFRINRIQAHAQLVTPHSVLLTPTLDSGLPDPAQKPYTVTAAHIAITCGTTPIVPSEDDVPGVKLGITSDGFFELEERPKKVLVVGAGYIATELSGVLNACVIPLQPLASRTLKL